MSSGIFRRIVQIVRHIGITSDNAVSRETSILATKISCGLGLIGVGVHASYAVFSDTDEDIKVIKKYSMIRNGFTDFMIIDSQGRHFNVNNSFWFWKWDSVEDWHNIKEGDIIHIKYYGWRWPVYGLFPNIVSTDLIIKSKNDNYTIKPNDILAKSLVTYIHSTHK